MQLSIVIPCYNEENRIATSLDKISRYLSDRGISGEIIAVNDGSTDGTLGILQGRNDVKAISMSENRGKGAAVREGLLAATGDQVLFTDADLSTPIEEADKLLPMLDQYDIAIGSRQAPGTKIEKHQPPLRLLLGIAFGFTVRILFRIKYLDTQCGFKAMTGSAAKMVAERMRINGFTFDVEMLAIADHLNLKVAEVGVTWGDVRGSKLHPHREFQKIIKELSEIKRNIKALK